MGKAQSVKIIFIGDIVGRSGRKAVRHVLDNYTLMFSCGVPATLSCGVPADAVVIANAENAAGGFGLTKKVYRELLDSGIDVLTGGNHIWDKGQVGREREYFKMLATPVNLRKDPMSVIHLDKAGAPVTVINLVGRIFMSPGAADPFRTFDEIYETENCANRIVIVDFHAEATSEKNAFAEYTGGRATAVIGTHTHIQTADERILRNGTFFMSDAGSCRAADSVLGMTVKSSLARFLTEESGRVYVELDAPFVLNGAELEVDIETKKVKQFKRLNITFDIN